MRMALIGSGALATAVMEMLANLGNEVSLVALVTTERSLATARSLAGRFATTAQVTTTMPESGVDLVVEAAGQAAVTQHVLPYVRRGIPAVIGSVGALADEAVVQVLAEAAGRTRVQLIPGAIGGIDALAAAREAGLNTVHYIGRKPAAAWKGTPAEARVDLDHLEREAVIFEGSARKAALAFPKNANVAATVAWAGLGMDATQVRLIADPAVRRNSHEVRACGRFGAFTIVLENAPLAANPRTSALTACSIIRAVRHAAGGILI